MSKLTAAGGKNKKLLLAITGYSLLAVFMLLQIFPFYLSLVQAVQPKGFMPKMTLELLPQGVSLSNFSTAWKQAGLTGGYLASMGYAVSFTGITAFICVLTAYVLEKRKMKTGKYVFMFFMSALMVPGEILLITNYLLVNELGLFGTPFAVVLPGLVNVFGIFLMKQFMHTIPDVLVENARIEGAGDLKILTDVIIPLSMPMIATYCILTFSAQWNEYLWPKIVLGGSAVGAEKYYPVQLRLLAYAPVIDGNIMHPYAYTLRMAATIMTLAPVLIVYFVFQKRFTQSVSVSGLK